MRPRPGLDRLDDLFGHLIIFIGEFRLWGALSPIHLLSIWTLLSLVMAVYRVRQGNIRQHKIWMVVLYILALLVTGVFTL